MQIYIHMSLTVVNLLTVFGSTILMHELRFEVEKACIWHPTKLLCTSLQHKIRGYTIISSLPVRRLGILRLTTSILYPKVASYD